LVLLQNKILAPYPGAPDFIFADLSLDLYYYHTLESPDPNFTLSDTVYLATLSPAIQVENGELLKIRVVFSYPTIEEIM